VPVFASVKNTPVRGFVVPLVWDTQVEPPFVVRRMVPESPTAVLMTLSMQKTAQRYREVPLL
jgi:hypothetical protein